MRNAGPLLDDEWPEILNPVEGLLPLNAWIEEPKPSQRQER
jgi:hypothetical protein